MMKSSLALVIIAYNEEENIARCIQSAWAVADEIIVVDSFSTDKTAAIAESLGAKVVQHEFAGHIEQKNYAASLAGADYILSLDADEALSAELCESIVRFKEKPDAVACKMNRMNNYCGQWIKHGGWYPDRKLRLWKNQSGSWKGINPHDKFALYDEAGKTVILKGDILHYSYDSVDAHLLQSDKFAQISAESLYAAKVRFSYVKLIGSPIVKFLQDYVVKLGFLDGRNGFTIAKISAKATYLKYDYLLKLIKKNA